MLITAKPNGFTNQLMNNDPSSVEYHYITSNGVDTQFYKNTKIF